MARAHPESVGLKSRVNLFLSGSEVTPDPSRNTPIVREPVRRDDSNKLFGSTTLNNGIAVIDI